MVDSSAKVACPVARRLLKTYASAVRVLRDARAPLLRGMLPKDPGFRASREAVDEATRVLSSARREYWRHLRTHGCRNAELGGRQRETEDRLRKDMLEARELFDSASEKHDYLISLSADSAGTPDGGLAFEQAQRVRVRAYEVYFEALRRYADYAVFGELPADPGGRGSEQSKPN
jgi:hypothetical protein